MSAGIGLHPWEAIVAVAMGLVAAGGWAAALALHVASGRGELDDPLGRIRFVSTIGIVIGGIFLTLIVFTGAGALALDGVPDMSRRIALVALGVVAVLLVALLMAPSGASGGTGRAAPLDVPLVHRGAALYAANCSQCHGVNGAGRSRAGSGERGRRCRRDRPLAAWRRRARGRLLPENGVHAAAEPL